MYPEILQLIYLRVPPKFHPRLCPASADHRMPTGIAALNSSFNNNEQGTLFVGGSIQADNVFFGSEFFAIIRA